MQRASAGYFNMRWWLKQDNMIGRIAVVTGLVRAVELATVDGVAEVAGVGGFVKEYQVRVDHKLRAYDVSLQDVMAAVRGANAETGGRTLEMAETEYMIRSFGYVNKPQDLAQAVLKRSMAHL